MLRWIGKGLAFIVYSNIFIAIAATLFAAGTPLMFGKNLEFLPSLGVIFFSTLLEYNLSRVISVRRHDQSYELRHAEKWTQNNLYIHYALLVIAVIGLVFYFFQLSALNQLVFTILGLITMAYTLPLLPIKKRFFRLRELPLTKVVLVAMVWATATTVTPIYDGVFEVPFSDLLILTVQRMFFIFAITIPFDIRDTGRDEKSDIITIPIRYGNKAALRMSVYAMITFLLIEILKVVMERSLNSSNIAMMLNGLFVIFVLTNKSISQRKYYHYGVLDGTILLHFFILLVFTSL